MSEYGEFLARKERLWQGSGQPIQPDALPSVLRPFQDRLSRWALRKGRAAIWADTGLGKTLMQLAWAQEIPGRVLILAPLCVGSQTQREALGKLGLEVGHFGSGTRIEILNYDRLHHVDPTNYAGVVLDESSILKSLDGKTRTKLIAMFSATPYRLCCTATPAPNDIAELANHCEFLGIMTRAEMLASFFVHEQGQDWRLKRHATDAFFRWLATWGMFLRRPSDLGFSDDGYDLPPLRIHEHVVSTDARADGWLFTDAASIDLRGRLAARRDSVAERVEEAAALIGAHARDQWIAWCGLNPEQDQLAAALGDGAVSIQGSDSVEDKEARLLAFLRGDARVLVTKLRIAGFGLNMQHCHRMLFLGLGDSYEQYYQGIRRAWRFGQTQAVDVHVVVSNLERVVVENIRRKESDAALMASQLIGHMAEMEREELGMTKRESAAYEPRVTTGDGWEMRLGDCVEELRTLADDSVDLSVYSPPFVSLYTYSASARDLGNCGTHAEFLEHFGYVVRELLRVTKPGRLTCCHLSQITSQLAKDGVIGLIDIRGLVIDCFKAAGWIHHGEAAIDKNPQAQAIRTKSKALLFVQLHKDATWSRPALLDFLLIFRKPGDNAVPVVPDVSNEQWIQWAHGVWYDIRETRTLNVVEARGDSDERHICPLQLDLIERCVRLWSNPGETVLSPFAGIGSEGYEAVRLGRRFVGIELKPEYHACAVRNLTDAARLREQRDLFAQPA